MIIITVRLRTRTIDIDSRYVRYTANTTFSFIAVYTTVCVIRALICLRPYCESPIDCVAQTNKGTDTIIIFYNIVMIVLGQAYSIGPTYIC